MIKPIITAATLVALSSLPALAQNKCTTGTSQSPIDINGTEPAITHALMPNYDVTPLNLVNAGGTVSQTYSLGSKLTVGNKSYDLMKFDFKVPSEHTVMGKNYDAEIQFVHGNKSATYAIVSVFVKEGAHNKAATEILASMPAAGQTNTKATTMINGRDLMPHNKSYFRYMGSTTSGTCAEGVSWYVIKEPIEMSAAQINRLKAAGNNARAVQPRNFRLIIDSNSK